MTQDNQPSPDPLTPEGQDGVSGDGVSEFPFSFDSVKADSVFKTYTPKDENKHK